jgi:hypothetical protein
VGFAQTLREAVGLPAAATDDELSARLDGAVRRLVERPGAVALSDAVSSTGQAGDDPQGELHRLVCADMEAFGVDYGAALHEVTRRQPELAERARTAAYLPETVRGPTRGEVS